MDDAGVAGCPGMDTSSRDTSQCSRRVDSAIYDTFPRNQKRSPAKGVPRLATLDLQNLPWLQLGDFADPGFTHLHVSVRDTGSDVMPVNRLEPELQRQEILRIRK